MAKIKYATGINPIIGEHGGFVFQNGREYPVITSSKKNDRHRRPVQWQRQAIMFKLVKLWRDLSSTYKTAWENFATTYPQPTHRYSTVYLSGQQLFLKRNFYQLLNFGIDSDPILEPIMGSFVQDDCTPTLKLENDRLILYLEFSNYTEDLIYQFFCSRQTSPGKIFPVNFSRYVGFAVNSLPIIPNYGILYNWYAATDVRNIISPGWHVPTRSELETLQALAGGASVAGGPLKETGFVHWASPNTGATNSLGLTLRGSGTRSDLGYYTGLNNINTFWTSTPTSANAICSGAWHNSTIFFVGQNYRYEGKTLRAIKDDSILADYIGNNGFIYPTVKIGSQVWTALPLIETHYSNMDEIPYVEDRLTWNALTSGAYCFYDDDYLNAVSFSDNSLDITDLYLSRFGILPQVGDNVLLQILPMSLNSGQFFDKQYFELIIE